MEQQSHGSDNPYASSSPRNAESDVGGGGDSRRGNGQGLDVLREFLAQNLMRSPLSLALEYAGLMLVPPPERSAESASVNAVNPTVVFPPANSPDSLRLSAEHCAAGTSGEESAEVSIIIGEAQEGCAEGGGELVRTAVLSDDQPGSARSAGEREPLVPSSPSAARPGVSRVESFGSDSGSGGETDESAYQSYDVQQITQWIEQLLPFSILLLVVLIRQHLIGFFVTIWVSIVMYKSNNIVRRQTALKGERKSYVLVGIFLAFMLHKIAIYLWFRNDDILYPLVMLPPKASPPFWHAIFIILINDILMRQAAMALKCLVLIYYKNGRGYNFRRQGQLLTLIEYTILLYRTLVPTPVWYRFFLNKENGSLFSSLITGLYLTFKLMSVVGKARLFVSAANALSRMEILYGCHATPEQVNAAGDLCAICQENMHSPILLHCKHIFCEDCVSEWFERERTCPLCRALVKPADLRTFGDGSTSLLFQLF